LKLTLGQIADWIHAEGEFDDAAVAFAYSIDSRTIGAGELFFAVKGERVDGHDYVEAAIANGAVAAVVSQRWLVPAGFDACKLLRVPDECDDCVLDAMQKLAQRVRREWGKRVIGITGSAGKTTTKECVAQVLSAKFNVLKTEGNLNNHYGVPLQLLRLEPEHDIAVIEMGMNHAGEIRALAKIAEPDWGVVSNVGMAHVEFFADGIEGVARAKRELIEALPANGVAFLNAEDERVRRFGEGLPLKVVLYGTSADADVQAIDLAERGLFGTDFTRVSDGLVEGATTRWPVHLHLPGRHNVLNALAAFAVGREAGVEIGDAVAALASTEATRRILIAGEMRELGAEGAALHAACGLAAAAAGIDVVVGVLGLAKVLADEALSVGAEALFVETPEEAGIWMRENLREGDVVLLKASRGVRLEQALDALAK
jgi:UDP-N-acetylmuramoyl-tripeptide--D-alanyl-D-alanine ligase